MKWKILLFMFLGLMVSVGAQTTANPEWKLYLDGYEIEHIADAGNYLWMTNETEVIKFDKATGNAVFYSFDGILTSSEYRITSIACNENDLPWIGVDYIGVLKMNEDKQWSVLPIPESENYVVGDILITDSGTLWAWMVIPFSTSLEDMKTILVRYQGNTVDIFTRDNLISSFAKDKDENLWFGEWYPNPSTLNLVKYDGENWTTFNAPAEWLQTFTLFRDIIVDELGNKWIVRSFSIMPSLYNLVKFNDTEWQDFDLPIEYSMVYSLSLQDDSIIWLASSDGLMKFSNYQWTVYDTENSELSTNHINSIVIDHNGTKWMGTDQGLVAFNENGLLSTNDHLKMMNDIALYPNPAKDFITLKLPEGLQKSTVDILNIQGSIMKTFFINNNRNMLDVSQLPFGIYLIRIQADENHTVKKFIKQ